MCSTSSECVLLLHQVRERRIDEEAKAVHFINQANRDAELAVGVEADLYHHQARVQNVEGYLVHQQATAKVLEDKLSRLRGTRQEAMSMAKDDLAKSEEAERAAEAAEQQQEEIHAELQLNPQERCMEALPSCVVGVSAVRFRDVLKVVRDVLGPTVACTAVFLLGFTSLCLPPSKQALGFAIVALAVWPLFAGAVVKDTVGLTSKNDPDPAKLEVVQLEAAIFLAFLTLLGSRGWTISLGAGLGLLVAELLVQGMSGLVTITMRGGMAVVGCLAGWHRGRLTRAMALAALGGLLLASAICALITDLSAAWYHHVGWETVLLNALPWVQPSQGMENTSSVAQVLWLIFLLPSLVRLARYKADIKFSWDPRSIAPSPAVSTVGSPRLTEPLLPPVPPPPAQTIPAPVAASGDTGAGLGFSRPSTPPVIPTPPRSPLLAPTRLLSSSSAAAASLPIPRRPDLEAFAELDKLELQELLARFAQSMECLRESLYDVPPPVSSAPMQPPPLPVC